MTAWSEVESSVVTGLTPADVDEPTRLLPGEVGLPSEPRRRTPGLRREEVTQLAGMSADYLMRLEQARSPQPSTQLLAARALFGCHCTIEEPDRNIPWRWFTDAFVREAYPEEEHAEYSRLHVADLRAAVVRRGDDPAAAALVERLRAASEEFTRLWELHEVAVRRASRMRLRHPAIGPMEFDYEALLAPAEDQRLLIYTPPPGSKTFEALELLRVVGPETAHRSHR
ncbi:helix-turn-helix domain-containing protein [Streptosporangium lutulentum]|uniref:Transcriptional regulator with XRE-family HTH domain n=1 Tax=Streptosporangium lutulentum TaxID=1461250 RepID=A0ABT9QP67_9ACTN|nr:helix-turn-helix domain-containing protein [Streptosporangium lutulentum]MDP9848558.1 transcriptional regulator with XRE-family HTH domain [Streptosporangium lutulentum]